ncbi:hypothetical protein HanXRQr2_Chr09g0388831 [Helianthus annuus]|uniref:Uncharacterized protein n=1 Tax=Helianthus annuus TaxID=4232 RepID=A0A251SZ40_HELAN|nr:hypothetical protein HanXRQr2_Chr09g0388831 [Helianthus annuus]
MNKVQNFSVCVCVFCTCSREREKGKNTFKNKNSKFSKLERKLMVNLLHEP